MLRHSTQRPSRQTSVGRSVTLNECRAATQADAAAARLDRLRMGIPSDPYGAVTVKQNDLLRVTSSLSVLLLALHISQDIVFGFDRAGPDNEA